MGTKGRAALPRYKKIIKNHSKTGDQPYWRNTETPAISERNEKQKNNETYLSFMSVSLTETYACAADILVLGKSVKTVNRLL